jgi:hypothetical protein
LQKRTKRGEWECPKIDVDAPLAIQSLSRLLEPAPIVIFIVLACALQDNSRSSQLPRMIAEELSSQLVLLVLDLNRLEETAGLLRFRPVLLIGFEDNLELGGSGEGLYTLPDRLMADGCVTDQNLSRRNVRYDIHPLRKLRNLSTGLLSESSSPDTKRGEVVFAHDQIAATV